MDSLDMLRSGVTVASFLVFIALWIWAWRAERKPQFDEAAQLPFLEEGPAATVQGEQR